MMNTAGAYLLILIFTGAGLPGGIATTDAESFEACKAMITQIQPIRGIEAYCVAKTLQK